MTTPQTTSKIVTFARPFTALKAVDRMLPPGDVGVMTDEELIEELSFPVYRQIATMIFSTAKLLATLPQSRWWHRSSSSLRRRKIRTRKSQKHPVQLTIAIAVRDDHETLTNAE